MTHFGREALRGRHDVEEMSALAEPIGVVSTPAHHSVLTNRLSAAPLPGSMAVGRYAVFQYWTSLSAENSFADLMSD